MEMIFYNKLSSKNENLNNLIVDTSNALNNYEEFLNLKMIYDKIHILFYDNSFKHEDAIDFWLDLIKIKARPIGDISKKASSISNNNEGSIRLYVPFLYKEIPENIILNNYVEYILHHEFCHLILQEGKGIIIASEFLSLANEYQSIPERARARRPDSNGTRMFGVDTIIAVSHVKA